MHRLYICIVYCIFLHLFWHFPRTTSYGWEQWSAMVSYFQPYFYLYLISYPSSSLFLCDPHLSFPPTSPPSIGPAALPCHICHRHSVAYVALGFKFNLVSIWCNCFERPAVSACFYSLMSALILNSVCLSRDEYVWNFLLMSARVCRSWTTAWLHTVNETHCQTPVAVIGLTLSLWQHSDAMHFLFEAEGEEGRKRSKYARHHKIPF